MRSPGRSWRREFVEFNRTLAFAAEKGLPVEASAAMFAETAEPGPFANALSGVSEAMRQGARLSEAVRRFPDAFPAEYPGLVEAGERGGNLGPILRLVASQHEILDRVAARMKRILAYLVAGMTVGMIGVGFASFFYAQTAPFQQALGEGRWTLPPELRRMFETPEGVAAFFLSLVLFGLAAVGVIHAFLTRTAAGEWVPVWSRLRRYQDLSAFCSSMAIHLRAGQGLIGAIVNAAASMATRRGRRAVEFLLAEAREGAGVSDLLTLGFIHHPRFFPHSLAEAVSLGEARGDAAGAFEDCACLYGAEMEQSADLVASLLSPIGIIILAHFAGAMILKIFLPILKLQSVLTGGGGGRGGRFVRGAWQQAGWLETFLDFLRELVLSALPMIIPLLVFVIPLALFYRFGPRRRAQFRLFAEHLSFLVRRGLPIVTGLHAIGDDVRGWLGRSLHEVAERVGQGLSLSEALAERPGRFPALFRGMAALGEKHGDLAGFLDAYRARDSEPRRPGSSLSYLFIYPALVVAITVFVMTFIVPKFKPIFEALGGLPSLPFSTVTMLWFGEFLSTWLPWGSLAFLAACFPAWWAIRSGRFSLRAAGFLSWLPGVGAFVRNRAAACFSAAVGLMVRAGTPLPEAVREASRLDGMGPFENSCVRLAYGLESGERLGMLCRRDRALPAGFAWFADAGEASGDLPASLGHAAEHYDARFAFARETGAKIFVPLFILANAVFVAWIFWGLASPIFLLTIRLTGG